MYESTGDNQARDHLVKRYAPLVKRIAHHMMGRLPANVAIDDLIQNGMMGLLDAVRRGDEQSPEQFEAYAAQRIRGAMLDGLRAMDWLPRSLRQEMRRIEAALRSLEQTQGRAPTEAEIAQSMGIPLEEYHRLLLEARGHQLVYFEDFGQGDESDFFDHHCGSKDVDPFEILADQSIRARLVEIITTLPEREKLVMSLYYEEELNLREIGAVLGVSESRVCQLHAQAVARLRSRMFAEARRSEGPRRSLSV